jgi:hypothetical protein
MKPKVIRIALVLVTLAVLALTLSACVALKPGSVQTSQPGGIGNFHINFQLCNAEGGSGAPEECGPDNFDGEAQVVLAFVVTRGVTGVPATFTANPGSAGGAPITFHRNPDFEAYLRGLSEFPEDLEPLGYLSEPFEEQTNDAFEWAVNYPLGLPASADGGPFVGPIKYLLVSGWREVGPGLSPDRPVECVSAPPGASASCQIEREVEFGVSDLKVTPPAETAVYAGATPVLPFSLYFGSTATPPPSSLALSATTNLPGATATPSEPSFAIGGLDSGGRFAGQPKAVVAVPAKAEEGLYEVRLNATTPTGGSAGAVALLRVKVARIGVKAKLNRSRGTAVLTVTVPTAGSLVVSGKGIVRAQRQPDAAKTVKVTVRTRGKAKKRLHAKGRAKVSATVTFTPPGAAAVTATKRLHLKTAAKR